MTSESKNTVGRRDFLKTLGVGAGAAAVAAAPLATQAVADTETADERTKTRYKGDSADVQAYYRVNSYPK